MGKVPVYEEGLAVICGTCRLPMWWQGKKPAIRACGCTPEPAAKPAFGSVTLKAKAPTADKGRRGERKAIRLMTGAGLLAMQTAGSGATASRSCERHFDTDIIATLGDLKIRVESKAMAKVPGLHSMEKLLAGSDCLRVQEDGAEGFWLMPDALMVQILAMAREGAR